MRAGISWGHPSPQKRFCISRMCQHPGSLPGRARLPASIGPALAAPLHQQPAAGFGGWDALALPSLFGSKALLLFPVSPYPPRALQQGSPRLARTWHSLGWEQPRRDALTLLPALWCLKGLVQAMSSA